MKIKTLCAISFNIFFLYLNGSEKTELSKDIIKLESVVYKKVDVVTSPMEKCEWKNYLPCNPSICTIDDGYLVICRTVNYEIDVEKNYCKYTTCSSYKTKNILVLYDKEFRKIKEVPVIDYVPKNYFKQVGLEDCRIFKWDNEFWFTATTYDTSKNNIARVLLGKLKNINNNEIIEFDKLIDLEPINPNAWEKNWLPFVVNNRLYMVYSYDPFKVLEVEKNGLYKVVINENQKFNFSQFRGSAAPIAFKGGYLLMIHENKIPKIWPFTTNMQYCHRFLYLDSDFKIKKVSNRFTFKDETFEFVCGMSLNHDEQKLILGLGIWDREAYLSFLDVDYVWSLLQDI